MDEEARTWLTNTSQPLPQLPGEIWQMIYYKILFQLRDSVQLNNMPGVTMLTGRGLQDAACLSCASRGLRHAYQQVLTADISLSLQVEERIRSSAERRRIVRRQTLSQHGACFKHEVVSQCASCLLVMAVLAAVAPLVCSSHQQYIPQMLILMAYMAAQLMLHSTVAAASYYTSASLGTSAAVVGGMLILGLIMSSANLFNSKMQVLFGISAFCSWILGSMEWRSVVNSLRSRSSRRKKNCYL
ncbi:hypothetical protein CEUSTIGMA_g3052.t1 [Chlamydomonas eustigma]|uniref:Uncharacterized protein n=1 Tax=Chlamydomonas eustigma TaxID=1157962 RepID=A0A250WXN4_9CHLO|nr:hypothetical protein CEUSTIGMA_g3052.t1 [Chlamydomonas eustigma]|eukprot:GAX75608.1 hypothetical protein CEUSTIGMA_g3052.t1 [Chlamydomonas eustigma]